MSKFLKIALFFISFSTFCQDVKVVFRYDDFMLIKDDFNERVVDLFLEKKIPLVLGVIPANENEQLILENNYAYLPTLKKGVQKGILEIALHGLSHYKFKDGEFDGMNYKEQYRRISKGKSLIENIFKDSVLTFIPPWNAYDHYTLKALEKCRIKNISSSLTENQSISIMSINYYPGTIENPKFLLQVIEANKNRGAIVILTFHKYDFNASFKLSDLENILTATKSSPNVKAYTFKQLHSANEVGNRQRFKANLESNFLYKKLHLNGALQTYKYSLFIRVLNVGIYVMLTLVAYFALLRLPFFNERKKFEYGFLRPSLLSFIIFLGVWGHLASPMKLVLICVVFALVFALVPTLKNSE